MVLLEFLNFGSGLIIAIILIPTILIVYCLIDILRSEFKTSIMKLLFLALVLFAPFLGSIIYLVIRKDYIKSKDLQSF